MPHLTMTIDALEDTVTNLVGFQKAHLRIQSFNHHIYG